MWISNIALMIVADTHGSLFDHGFCCVRVSIIIGLPGTVLLLTGIYTLEDAIEFHAFAPPLEALACV